MISSIQIRPIDPYPYYDVILNGEKLAYITEDNSPTGRSGYTRFVYMSEDYVVKIGSIGESKLEIRPEDRCYFAEVVLVDIEQQWLVQRRIKCEADPVITLDDWQTIIETAEEYNVGDIYYRWDESLGKRRNHNWTVDITGQPVIFDYDPNGQHYCGFSVGQWNTFDTNHDSQCSCSDCLWAQDYSFEEE